MEASKSSMKSIKIIDSESVRRLVVHKQMLAPSMQGCSKGDVVNIVSKIGGIQYDPLPIVAQAHYLTLWNRVKGFHEDWLDSLLYEDRLLVETELMRQVMHIVPIHELPYYYQATRTARFQSGRNIFDISKYTVDIKLYINKILRKIERKDVISISDFDKKERGLIKTVLFYLLWNGKIIIVRRDKGPFRRAYYGFPDRFIKNFPDLNSVSEEESREWLILKILGAFGISSKRHIARYIGYSLDEVDEILKKLERKGEISKVKVKGIKKEQYIHAIDERVLENSEQEEDHISLLTPIDNLVRDRKWLREVFGYTFKLEYFRKKKMKWQTSILYNTDFLGFINPKADRPMKTIIIKEVVLNRDLNESELSKLFYRIVDFAKFHGADKVEFWKPQPEKIRCYLKRISSRETNETFIIDST